MGYTDHVRGKTPFLGPSYSFYILFTEQTGASKPSTIRETNRKIEGIEQVKHICSDIFSAFLL